MSVFKEIKIKEILPNPYQPRTDFEEQAIQELANSIKENGLIQPITVRKTNDGYQIIAGERRYRAYQLNKEDTIPAYIIDADESSTAQLALIENIQRENLSAIEEANAYLQILRMANLTQQQLADKLGKSQSTIANKLRLLNLDQTVIEAIDSKEITERHGRAMLSLDPTQQKKLLQTIKNKDLNVKQTEQTVETILKPVKKVTKKCFGCSSLLLVNEVLDAYKRIREITPDVGLQKAEDEENYIITITIKK